MANDQDESCPCGSGIPYFDCCKKEYDKANAAKDKIKAALSDPKTSKELQDLLDKFNKEK